MSIIALLITAVILIAFFLWWWSFKSFKKAKAKLNKAEYLQYWQKILICLNNEDKFSLAVIEADKLLDRAFKERGFKGKTMGERLVSAGSHLSDKNSVWQVHKLRNQLVHEMDIELNFKQTRRALDIFAQALTDVGAL